MILLGCGALKELESKSGEVKSMRTAKPHRRKGIAGKILEHILTLRAPEGTRILKTFLP